MKGLHDDDEKEISTRKGNCCGRRGFKYASRSKSKVPGKSDHFFSLLKVPCLSYGEQCRYRRTFAHHSFDPRGNKSRSIAVIQEKAAKVQAGDLSEMEALLVAQATSLDAIYTEMARRAALNMGEHLAATEIYMRLALQAQAQCRKYAGIIGGNQSARHVSFVKQASIAHGPQQVNNGLRPRTGNNSIQSNELLEAQHGNYLDTGTTGETIGINSELATVGEIDRAAN
ncbi:MAG: hypothetical protein IPG34_11950 [Rhodocyclaceae bacterium]|nr:hypothetical protein [Rhodocyclaceae bacterium]